MAGRRVARRRRPHDRRVDLGRRVAHLARGAGPRRRGARSLVHAWRRRQRREQPAGAWGTSFVRRRHRRRRRRARECARCFDELGVDACGSGRARRPAHDAQDARRRPQPASRARRLGVDRAAARSGPRPPRRRACAPIVVRRRRRRAERLRERTASPRRRRGGARRAGRRRRSEAAERRMFAGVTCIAPNAAEAARASGIAIVDDLSLERAARALLRDVGCRFVLVTRGEHGMSLFAADGERFDVPAVARTVFDVSGAGDTAVAVADARARRGDRRRDGDAARELRRRSSRREARNRDCDAGRDRRADGARAWRLSASRHRFSSSRPRGVARAPRAAGDASSRPTASSTFSTPGTPRRSRGRARRATP